MNTTPGVVFCVTRARRTMDPRREVTLTGLPSATFRRAASAGLISMSASGNRSSSHECRVSVPQGIDGYARKEVQVALPVDVPHVATLAAHQLRK